MNVDMESSGKDYRPNTSWGETNVAKGVWRCESEGNECESQPSSQDPLQVWVAIGEMQCALRARHAAGVPCDTEIVSKCYRCTIGAGPGTPCHEPFRPIT